MPGGHCPIVRPHPHHTKKNLPRVGDPLEKSLSTGTDPHTKQALRLTQATKTEYRYKKPKTVPGDTILGHPNHGFSTSVLGSQNGARKPCFLGPKPPSGRWFFEPCFGYPPGTPKKVVPEPPKTWSRNPCFGPLFWDRKQAPKPWFSSPKPWFWAPKPLFWVKTAGKV